MYYPVMIVENSRMRIRRIKNMLPWNEYGFQVTTICDDTQKAISYYGEYLHQIVFVALSSFCEEDFCIIRQLRLLSGEITIIGISKSGDYNTVRYAFKAGCNDVLLERDVSYIYIKEILEEKKNVLDHNLNSGSVAGGWKNRMETYLGLIRDKQRVDEKLILDLLENESDLDILEGEYRLLLFRMDDIRRFNRASSEYDRPKWKSSDEFISLYQQRLVYRDEVYRHLNVIVEDIMRDYSGLRLLFPKKHCGLMILPEMGREEALSLAQCIQNTIYRELGMDFSCCITQSAVGITSFLNAYRQILELIPMKFYKGNRCILIMDEEKPFVSSGYRTVSLKEHLLPAFEKNDLSGCISEVGRVFDAMEKENLHPDEVKKILCGFITEVEHWMHRKEIALDYPFEVFKRGLSESESLSYMKKEMEKILNIMFGQIAEREQQKTSKKVAMMIHYIQQHLSEKLSLNEIADCVELSEIHTSRLFKKEMGVRLTEYINAQRIERAKELLASTDIKIKDVAAQVGIADQLYFAKVFKKETGVPPREFRRMQ